ncbi:MAG TPA: VOC family protein [Azospirillaceae bacterium]|nr:VOC family protein [Azospirillaceae bacterium]
MSTPFTLRGLDHVVIRARDIAALERFYVEVLGCTVEKRQLEGRLVQLRAGASLIDLWDATGEAPPEGRNMDHLCLAVAPFDPAAIAAHLARFGIDAGEPVSRYGAEGEGPSLYLADPEGNGIELKGPPGGMP